MNEETPVLQSSDEIRAGSPVGSSDIRHSFVILSSFVPSWWRNFCLAPLRQANGEARAFLASAAGQRPDRKVLTVLLAAALLLTVQRYFCMTDELPAVARLLRGLGLEALPDWLRGLRPRTLPALAWWAVGTFVLYLVVPALIVRLAFGERLADYGLKWRGACAGGWVYVGMLAVVGPLVLLASRNAEFQATYPFYRLPGDGLGADVWCWEALYALQFVGLEFFFRGFLLHGLRHRFGAYAIVVATVPYCMVHFTKPLPETLASIVAGLALGFMSLKTRSIFLGAAIHITVALMMDLAALGRRGYFG
jgi:membrane protease YdiL (CAAX protease family)